VGMADYNPARILCTFYCTETALQV
jgi:hypothetical protein